MGSSASKASSGPKITAQDRAILDLKLQRDKIKQYQKKLQTVLDREHQLAKEALSRGDKSKALTALRRRKYQEGLILKTDSQLETLENLVSTIEFSQIEQSVVLGLEQGNKVLKEIHKEMSVESVERLMEETAEAQSYQREIDEMLASRMTNEEEDAVQIELAELERQATTTNVPDRVEGDLVRQPVHLPSAPKTEPVSPVKETEQVQEEQQQQVQERIKEAILA
ncbi:Snf7-domain-containing protein [Violaceomyces palustris]|uniref:Snf7-domain-containing protein n=1 Tax=Violaceomyces palustris TaxID=1673888 RepID=A0ACD0NMS7_9BASI|nr:Snf7-domain-containing protein [Violaceomyces palustris]